MSDYVTTREQRLQAARDALDAVRDGFYTVDGRKVPFPDRDYCKCSYVRLEDAPNRRSILGTPEYTVAAVDSFEALSLAEDTANAAVLNFACATTPGGGFLSGSKAQEECLCRMSTLYGSLTSPEAQPYYDNNLQIQATLKPVSFLYSPIVYVFRRPNLTYMDAPVQTQVITAAAPNLHRADHGASYIDVRNYLLDTMRAMFGYMNGRADTLILGAWGCGAFGNDPDAVAQYFRTVLHDEGYGRAFRKIIFAVRNENTKNFRVFHAAFSDMADVVGVTRKPRASAKSGKAADPDPLKFERGSIVYVVGKGSETGEEPQWGAQPVMVTSSGKKYVTVQFNSRKWKFMASDKPILRSVKGGEFLVGAEAMANRLCTMLETSPGANI